MKTRQSNRLRAPVVLLAAMMAATGLGGVAQAGERDRNRGGEHHGAERVRHQVTVDRDWRRGDHGSRPVGHRKHRGDRGHRHAPRWGHDRGRGWHKGRHHRRFRGAAPYRPDWHRYRHHRRHHYRPHYRHDRRHRRHGDWGYGVAFEVDGLTYWLSGTERR